MVAEGGGDAVGAHTPDAGDGGRRVVGDAAGDVPAGGVGDVDDVAAGEVAGHLADAGGQQAHALAAQGGYGAVVHQHLAPVAVADAGEHPAFAGFQFAGGGFEVGAGGLAGGGAEDGVGAASAADDHSDAGGGNQAGGVQFGGHTAPGPGVAVFAGHCGYAVVH